MLSALFSLLYAIHCLYCLDCLMPLTMLSVLLNFLSHFVLSLFATQKKVLKTIYNIFDDLFQSMDSFTFLIIPHPSFFVMLGCPHKVAPHCYVLTFSQYWLNILPGSLAQLFAPGHPERKTFTSPAPWSS